MTTMSVDEIPSKVIVIDDEKGITELISSVAEEFGYQVTCINYCELVSSTCKRVSPDLMFIDLELPGCDGIEILQFLSILECKAAIYLISGLGDGALASSVAVGRQMNLAMAGVLAKPFNITDLEAILEKHKLAA